MIAPKRAERHQEELAGCPFDAGNEHRTPLATLEIGDPWQLRVVPNLYPAFERQEVVVHVPRHATSFTDLSDDECALVAEAWQRRARDTSPRYLHALINEGRAAGASLEHTHSQLVWLDEAPPEVQTERARRGSSDLMARVHGQEGGNRPRPSLIVEAPRELVAFCHPAGRVPYEMVIQNAYLAEDSWFESDDLRGVLVLLRNVIRRLRAIEGPLPWNAWLHDGPHWHLHVLPRVATFAGIELGAGIYVNTLAPEDAAAALRGVAL